MMRGFFLLLAFWTLGAPSWAAPVKKVLVIGIDGCRFDALTKAHTPRLDGLIQHGALATNTDIVGRRETAADTISGPGWSSILTGVWADKHGVRDNEFEGAAYDEFPHFFQRLKEVEPARVTASVVSWEPIHDRIVRAADASFALGMETKDYGERDRQVARKSVELLGRPQLDALFVYYGDVDETGHAKGFHPTVPEYIAAIEQVDERVGMVLDALEAREKFESEDWLILVTTDHGGVGTGHDGGKDVPEIRTVFIIVSGAAAARGVIEGPTYLVDVPATALAHLGVPLSDAWRWDGRPIGLRTEDAATGDAAAGR